MSDFKRRDIGNLFNYVHIEQQKKLYNHDVFSDNTLMNFFEFSKNINLNLDDIDKNISLELSKLFNIGEKYVFWRQNIYEAIDFIFKTNIEIYENILLVNNVNSYYERSCHIYRGKCNKVNIEYGNNESNLELISSARKTNAKIIVLSTNSDVSLEFITHIVEDSYSLVVVEDFDNKFDFSDIISKNANIIALKSLCEKGANNAATVLLGHEVLIQNFKAMLNFGDIDVVTKLYALYKIALLKDEFTNIDTNSVVSENNAETSEVKETKETKETKIDEKIEETKAVSEEVKEDLTTESKEIESETKETEKQKYKLDIDYASILIPNNRQSLVDEVLKFKFISIFSSNHTHVYILCKTPIYMNLVDNGLVLKKYNASNGEIIRLNVDMFNQNIKVLEIIYEISKTRRIFMNF